MNATPCMSDLLDANREKRYQSLRSISIPCPPGQAKSLVIKVSLENILSSYEKRTLELGNQRRCGIEMARVLRWCPPRVLRRCHEITRNANETLSSESYSLANEKAPRPFTCYYYYALESPQARTFKHTAEKCVRFEIGVLTFS